MLWEFDLSLSFKRRIVVLLFLHQSWRQLFDNAYLWYPWCTYNNIVQTTSLSDLKLSTASTHCWGQTFRIFFLVWTKKSAWFVCWSLHQRIKKKLTTGLCPDQPSTMVWFIRICIFLFNNSDLKTNPRHLRQLAVTVREKASHITVHADVRFLLHTQTIHGDATSVGDQDL